MARKVPNVAVNDRWRKLRGIPYSRCRDNRRARRLGRVTKAEDREAASSAAREKRDPFAAKYRIPARQVCRPDVRILLRDPDCRFRFSSQRHVQTRARYFPAAKSPSAPEG